MHYTNKQAKSFRLPKDAKSGRLFPRDENANWLSKDRCWPQIMYMQATVNRINRLFL